LQEGEGDEAMERLSDDGGGSAAAAEEAAAATAAAAAAAGGADAAAAAASPSLTLALPARLALPPGALAELRSELFPPSGEEGALRDPPGFAPGGGRQARRKRRPSAGADARLDGGAATAGGAGDDAEAAEAPAARVPAPAPCAWLRAAPAMHPPALAPPAGGGEPGAGALAAPREARPPALGAGEAAAARSLVDAGLLLGRSFRAGWGPGGVLAVPGAPSLPMLLCFVSSF